MENASKALIIAGAILLSILIIGIGMLIFNQASNVIGGANLNPQEIQQYNTPFTQYGESNVSGSSVMSLCDEIRSHNLANQTDPSKQVQLISGVATDPTPAHTTAITTKSVNDIKKNLRSGLTYDITYGYDAKTGFITQVGIQPSK